MKISERTKNSIIFGFIGAAFILIADFIFQGNMRESLTSAVIFIIVCIILPPLIRLIKGDYRRK